MFRSARWKSEKNKIRAVFKFQFQATQVPRQGWEELVVSLFPVDAGKPTARSEKAAVVGGSCNWPAPVYETVRLTQDSKSGMINEKVYHFFLSATGSVKFGVLADFAINLADYAEAFKPSSVSLPLKPDSDETLLHVIVQRVQVEAEGRGTDDDGDLGMKNQRTTLRSQLSNPELEEGKAVENLANGVKVTEEASCVNHQSKMNLQSSQITTVHVESNANLRKSVSLDAISASGSESSSGIYTPKDNGNKNCISQLDYGSLLSPLSSNGTPRDPIIVAGNEWSMISVPYGSTDGSSSSSGEALLRDGSQGSDNIVEKLNTDFISVTRQLEVSKLELQTLRKQVIKESRRGQDLASELQSMKEEKDALERECEELKASRKRAADEEHVSTKLRFRGKDPWSMLEEAKQELNHEKSLNADLQLQLKKTHESNSELILAVRDLEELLQQKNGEFCLCGVSSTSIKVDIMEDFEEIKSKPRLLQLQYSDNQQESLETSMQEEDEQCALVELPIEVNYMFSPAQGVSHLTTELELYKEREEIEMQMEQLALDYEILKQENHDISTKLEQIQLREQLRMQCECSAHFPSISELESHVENLEKEIERQAKAFQVDIENISRAKDELERKLIQAEEALKKTRLHNFNIAEQLQGEFKRLTAQMSSSFYMNEKLVMQTLKECSELKLQKCQLEEMLEKSNKELELVSQQYHLKTQQYLSLIDFKNKEVDSLLLELKQKRKEIENQKVAEEARQRASSEQIAQLIAEVEKLSKKCDQLAEQIKVKDNLLEEMDQLKASITESDMLVQDFRKERSMLGEKLSVVEDEAKNLQQELNDLRHLKIENDTIFRNSNTELANPKGSIESSKRCKIYISKQSLHEFQADWNFHENTPLSEESRSNEHYMPNTIMEKKTKMKNVDSIGVELLTRNTGDDPEFQDERSILTACEQQKVTKVMEEMEELKEQNQVMEIELKDMQQRYSAMSLKFAEVEGERQLLVIKIRSLKNSMKI